MLSAALYLVSLGLSVHWLVPPRAGGKAPIHLDWAKRPRTSSDVLRSQFRAHYNLGIRTGWVLGAFSIVVVDLDDAAAVAWALSHLPHTPLRVLTRKGEHWYFACPLPPRLPALTRARVAKMALDVRGEGGQVVVPPSVHPLGPVYRWAELPTPSMLRSLPIYDPAWLPAPPQPPPVVPPTLHEGGSQRRALARARGAALKWRVLNEGEGRGTQTYSLACMLVHGLGLAPDDAFSVLASYWNPRLPQPYSPELLRRKVSEAQRAERANRPLVER